jgi:hypothetical protein
MGGGEEHAQMIYDNDAKKLDMVQKQMDRVWALINTVVSVMLGAFVTWLFSSKPDHHSTQTPTVQSKAALPEKLIPYADEEFK